MIRAGIVVALAAGVVGGACGKSDKGGPPSCEQAIQAAGLPREALDECKRDRWSDATRTCIAAAKNHLDAIGCMASDVTARGDTRTEGEYNLDRIEQALRIRHVDNAAFPTGVAGPTPSEDCCAFDNGKCVPSSTTWAADVWTALDFSIDVPIYFRYAYESADGTTATARAIADLDCDGTSVEWVLQARVDGGAPVFTLTKPARPD